MILETLEKAYIYFVKYPIIKFYHRLIWKMCLFSMLKPWPWLMWDWYPNVETMSGFQKFQPWLIWGWNEVGILTLVEIRLKSWCCFSVEILILVDMRLKGIWNPDRGSNQVEILALFQHWNPGLGRYEVEIPTLFHLSKTTWSISTLCQSCNMRLFQRWNNISLPAGMWHPNNENLKLWAGQGITRG